ncbi:hypothetical protein C8R44DRAFT_987259 [Mycena epipterygia]|nr:hypothetical protein C8R44DRAFT_987259 [Mycena epipterygia]
MDLPWGGIQIYKYQIFGHQVFSSRIIMRTVLIFIAAIAATAHALPLNTPRFGTRATDVQFVDVETRAGSHAKPRPNDAPTWRRDECTSDAPTWRREKPGSTDKNAGCSDDAPTW